MGRNILNNADQYSYASGTAAETIQSGDIVVNTSIGYCASTGQSIMAPAYNRQLNNLDTYLANNTITTTGYTSGLNNGLNNIRAYTLSNGNIVVIWIDNGTNNLLFNIYSPALALITGPTTVQTAINTAAEITGCALSAGGFVLVYRVGTITNYSIYTNTGTVTIGPTSVGVATSFTIYKVVQGTSGNIAIMLHQPGGVAQYLIISITGSIILTLTSTGINASGGNNVKSTSICALTGGNFVFLVYDENTNGVIVYTIRSNTGTLVLASTNTTIGGGGASSGFTAAIESTPLSNGNFLIVFSSNGRNFSSAVYTSTGTQVGSTYSVVGLSLSVNHLTITPVNSGFAVVFGGHNTSSSTSFIQTFNSVGTNIGSGSISHPSINWSTIVNFTKIVTDLNSNTVSLIFRTPAADTISSILFDCTNMVSPVGQLSTNTIASISNKSTIEVINIARSNTGANLTVTPAVLIYFSINNTLSIRYITSCVLQCITAGVSINSVTVGQTFSFINAGTARLRTAATNLVVYDAISLSGSKLINFGNLSKISNLSSTTTSLRVIS